MERSSSSSRIDAVGDDAAVAHEHRRDWDGWSCAIEVDDRRCPSNEARATIERSVAEQRPLQRRHDVAQLVDSEQRVGERQALARRRRAQRDARGDALEVGDLLQARGHLFEDRARAGQLVDRVVAVEDRRTRS